MKENSAIKKMFIGSLFAGLLIFSVWALLYYDKGINLHIIPLSRIINNREDITSVRCKVVQSFGKKGLLSMDMAIPCEDEKQLADLTK